MGATVCQAVALDPDLELVAAVDPRAAGVAVEGVTIAAEPRAFADSGADVVVDFTVAEAARRTVPWLAMHGIHAVVGTTGLTADDLAGFAEEFGDGGPNCVVAANFSISAVLMMRFAEIAAPWFDTAEIIELHHDGKADAPSGTAVTTAERMAAASDRWATDPTRTEVLPGARGGAGPAGIRTVCPPRVTISCGYTVPAPAGMGAPVMIRSASPAPSVPSNTAPAARSATTVRSRAPVRGMSSERTA